MAADAPAEVLATLGIRRHPLGRRRSPSQRCLTAVLARVDGDALDRAVAVHPTHGLDRPRERRDLRCAPHGQIPGGLVGPDQADYVAIVKTNQKNLYRQRRSLPRAEVGRGAFESGNGHGRIESRSIKACGIDPAAGDLPFPGAVTAIRIHRRRQIEGRKQSRETVYAVTSLEAHRASPADIAALVRRHWTIENRHQPGRGYHLC